MIPGNVDPRRAEKVQRYKPPQANGNAPVEDLTPDYMNILGPDSATANADVIEKTGGAHDPQPQQHDHGGVSAASSSQEANGTNVIPTSPQYGVAIVSSGDAAGGETTTAATDTVVETTAKTQLTAAPAAVSGEEGKDIMHSTPSRNDRFKVVKIASLEPFRRGRWKCMDYVDENPPQVAGQPPSKQTQSATNIQQMGLQYMQTQSLPQQHFQQMLVQGAFAGATAAGFYQGVPNQMLPGQYFYPGQTTVISQQVPVQSGGNAGMQFINSAGQQYFPANVPPHGASGGYTTYSNVQYVQPNLIQTQSSAFVPTSQTMANSSLPANFQQSQTYAGQTSTTQPPMVNGHAYPSGGAGADQQQQQQQQVASLPTQIAKNVILQPAIVSMNQTPPGGAQNSINQQAQYNPSYQTTSLPTNQSPQATPAQPGNITAATQGTQGTPIITPMVPIVLPPSSQMQNQTAASLTAAVAMNQMHMAQMNMPTMHSAPASSTNTIYLTAQGGMANVCDTNSNDGHGDGTHGVGGESRNSDNPESASGEDPAKANPVVNAIDNKIEQAMDLVKSHLMYTVREEVEVLKEKIVELMERIQQLETENAYLKQQVLKGAGGGAGGGATTTNGAATGANDGTPDPTLQTPTQQPAGPQ